MDHKINEIVGAVQENNISALVSNILSTNLSSLITLGGGNMETHSSSSGNNGTSDSEDSSSDLEYEGDVNSEGSSIDSEDNEEEEEEEKKETDFKTFLRLQNYSSQNIRRGINFRVNIEPVENLTTDAHSVADNLNSCDSHRITFPTQRTNITPDVIERLEEDLEFYEKVSLVFLLYDSDDLALQRLKTAHMSIHSGSITVIRLLSEWALSEHKLSSDWADKFLEALCIVQNFEICNKLGYDVNKLKERFLPFNPETSLFVDLMRKALYYICESLSAIQLNQLSQLVCADMEKEGRIPSRYDTEYMEMNILHWMSQRYLNVGIPGAYDTADVKNITKHLKVMGELNLVDYLESVARRCVRDDNRQGTESECGDSDQLSMRSSISHGPSSSHSVTSQCNESSSSLANLMDCYEINPHSVGYCVIINQKNFYKEPNPVLRDLVNEDTLETRVGTDVDRDRLCEIFLGFGFTVTIWENLTHAEIIEAVQEASKNLVRKDHSCFALCILSHGKKNAVYGVNSIAVDIDDIEKLLNGKFCPKLMHKPKILVIQACQGINKMNAIKSDIDTDGTSGSKTCPEVSDMITFWATVPGYAAFRDRITGSWFIKTLWEKMLQNSAVEMDVLNIFVNVIGKVCNKRAPVNGELKAMTPQFITTFTKPLFFPFHTEARKATARRILERYMFDYLIDQYIERMLKGYAVVKKKKKLC
ncbi:caspase-8 [Anabrus simplex]|uniref:caspase-8 n=1 Tax=Anabrus simplex TaxID=316456 RepID=UPI0035A30FB5